MAYFVEDNKNTSFAVQLKALPTEGNIAWEYNPLRNYRLDEDLYEYNDYYYNLWELADKFNICLKCKIVASYTYKGKDNEGKDKDITVTTDSNKWEEEYFKKKLVYTVTAENLDPEKYKKIVENAFKPNYNWNREALIRAIREANIQEWIGVPATKTDPLLREKGELVDFITNELEFNINHPIDILPQNSYDNSVNLIINDGNTYPKLINTRFSPRGKNTYEIVDRKGNSDSNIYDRGEQFKSDISLYKILDKFPKVELTNVYEGGALKVGNYFFYFRLADSDGNETDFFEESGLVSLFKGSSVYSSISTGQKDENSNKQVSFTLSNLDSSYYSVKVYYSRSSAEINQNRTTNHYKILQDYLIVGDKALVTITGYEPVEEISYEDINLTYSIVNAVNTQASAQNRLFFANIQKLKVPYEELADLSLRFLPIPEYKDYDVKLTNKYSIQSKCKGYIDPMYIYNNTGYWNKEIYRFGIVYILNNGELSPVFNIRGGYQLNKNSQYAPIALYTGKDARNYIEYNEETFKLVDTKDSNVLYENAKGVVQMDLDKDTDKIHYFKIETAPEVINELKKYVKGFFFVRQTRIPTILAQGITIGIDKYGRTPTIPVLGQETFKKQLDNLKDSTYVTSKNINGINYISEGFLSRYKYRFEKKHSSIWSKIGKIAILTVGVVALAAASIVTFGGAAVIGSVLAPVAAALASVGVGTEVAVVASIGITLAATAGAGALVGTMVAALDEIHLATNRNVTNLELKGREVVCPSGMVQKDAENSRKLAQNFEDRLIIKDPTQNEVRAIICPDYDINPTTLNSIICGNTHYVEIARSQLNDTIGPERSRYFDNNGRQFFIREYQDEDIQKAAYLQISAIEDNQKVGAVGEDLFYGRAGEAEEAWRYITISDHHIKDKSNEYAEENINNKTINSDIIRGSFGPYLATSEQGTFGPAEIVTIYIPGYDPTQYESYMYTRMKDYSSYHAVTPRININTLDDYIVNKTALEGDPEGPYQFDIFRGDCYICQYTHRLNRNFCDPAAPYNDEIVDPNCWRDNYDAKDADKLNNINLGDVNAIQLGMWITFKLRSSYNLNVLTIDESNIEEKIMSGHARAHYPQYPMSATGTYKIADSTYQNQGFKVSLSERTNFENPDVPYIKQWYGTRIMYSDIQVTDAFKNGFRQFWGTNFRDYPVDYGSITKIINLQGSLFCVFEHGIAIIPVNERSIAGSGAGGNVYINTSNILPENPKMISDKYGSQWKDSIIKTDSGIIYGVDTIAKKIWAYAGGDTVKCISDFKIQEFLNQNISLSERELNPIIGIRNVKTHYNAFKGDVMFTFYDNIYEFEEKSWNLCWNEILQKWITFYSWIPSYSENIYNQYFSFNRNTSKAISKLGISNAKSDFADGVTLTNNTISEESDYDEFTIVGILKLSNRTLPTGDNINSYIEYSLERDPWKNYKRFSIRWAEIIDGKIDHIHRKDYKNTKRLKNHYQILVYDHRDQYWEEVSELYKRTYTYKEDETSKIDTVILNDPLSDTEKHSLKTGEVLTSREITQSKPTSIYKENGIRVKSDNPHNPNDLVWYLNIKAIIYIENTEESNLVNRDRNEQYIDSYKNSIGMEAGYYQSMVAVIPKHNIQFLTTDFWKHGQSGIIDIKDPIKPTYWYGEQHPFEFEFIVKDNPDKHKVFENLEIISNKAAPESFHYEIVGECYDFAKEKNNMYIRQEATKELYQYNGSNITYDHLYKRLSETPKKELQGNIYEKSTIFPLFYCRQDYINNIKDDYYSYNEVLESYKKDTRTKDFDNLSGSEIVRYDTLNEYRIWNHAKAVDIKDNNLLRGNMTYKEDKWDITINPINYLQRNEKVSEYKTLDNKSEQIPIECSIFRLPNDIDLENETNIPSGWNRNKTEWDKDSKFGQVKMKDKYIKIRIRYKGDNLAVILAINTLYSISYA